MEPSDRIGARRRHNGGVGVRQDCRHYSTRTTNDGLVQRCRVGASGDTPFSCPEGCLFFEPRSITDAGWQRFDDERGKQGRGGEGRGGR